MDPLIAAAPHALEAGLVQWAARRTAAARGFRILCV